jgi:putative DNA primase/helicase
MEYSNLPNGHTTSKTDEFLAARETQSIDANSLTASQQADARSPKLKAPPQKASVVANSAITIQELVALCDPNEPIQFLKQLDPDGWHNLVCIHPITEKLAGRTFPPGSWTEIRKWIAARIGRYNLYFSVNEPEPNARDNKLSKQDIAAIRAIHVDIDPNEKDASRFTAERARIEKIVDELMCNSASPPSIVIGSGGGYQCFWKLSEKLPAGSPGDGSHGDWAERQAAAISKLLGGDSTHDRSRLMRLTGTVNLPNAKKRAKGRTPAIACLESSNDRTYSQDDLRTIAAPATSEKSNAVKGKSEQDAEIEAEKKQLDMAQIQSVAEIGDLSAELRERFERASKRNWKLAAIWEGDEDALLGSDDTGSGYRLAFAHHSRADGFTAQEYALLLQTRDYAFQGDANAKRRQIARDWVRGCPQALKEFGDAGHADNLVRPPGDPMPNARAFLANKYGHADRTLLIHQGGQFYHWNGTCWPALEEPVLRSELYGYFETKSYQESEKTKPFAPTGRKVADLMDAIRAITFVSTDTPTPAWLDKSGQPAPEFKSGQPAAELVSCENGLVHWPTRTRLDHRPDFYVHHSLRFVFDPKAAPPERWHEFLRELWGDDQESIDTLQEMFGYLVSGDTRQQKIFFLIGPKRGGKGTIARVLEQMLGRHNVAGPTLASLATNFGLQGLITKPVAIIPDARMGHKSDLAAIAERLLSISGEDLQNVDRKFQEPWSGYLPTRFVIISNELPRFTDASGALASRFIVLMLQKSFYGKENPDLTAALCEELPGIFNWALDGLQSLRARGRFIQPQTGREAIQELEDLASPVGAFVRDCCTLGPDKTAPVDALYNRYRRWCLDDGRTPLSKSMFGRDLKAQRPELKRSRLGQDRTPVYLGVALKSIAAADDYLCDSRGSLGNQDCNVDESKNQPTTLGASPEPSSLVENGI